MATVKISFEVFDVPEGDTGTDSKTINKLIDILGDVETNLSWDNVEWEIVND